MTSAQLELLFKPVCASGQWSTGPCPVPGVIARCQFTERTDLEDMGITQTVHVYAGSGETAASSQQRCVSGQFDGMSAAGIWAAAGGAASEGTGRLDVRDAKESVESTHEACNPPGPDLLAATIGEIACEADEIQFGFRP